MSTDADRLSFLDTLASVVLRYNWICHIYCLMGNHYHIVIETPDANLSQGMRQLNGSYTQLFSKRHGRRPLKDTFHLVSKIIKSSIDKK